MLYQAWLGCWSLELKIIQILNFMEQSEFGLIFFYLNHIIAANFYPLKYEYLVMGNDTNCKSQVKSLTRPDNCSLIFYKMLCPTEASCFILDRSIFQVHGLCYQAVSRCPWIISIILVTEVINLTFLSKTNFCKILLCSFVLNYRI